MTGKSIKPVTRQKRRRQLGGGNHSALKTREQKRGANLAAKQSQPITRRQMRGAKLAKTI